MNTSTCLESITYRLLGANPLTHLNAKTLSIYLRKLVTGSHINSLNTGVNLQFAQQSGVSFIHAQAHVGQADMLGEFCATFIFEWLFSALTFLFFCSLPSTPFFPHYYHSVKRAQMSLCGGSWPGCWDCQPQEHFTVQGPADHS